ncbi:MAG: DnaJ domain-containing protein [Deltaproteobacteria bacterium]|nr:DnaJ domain-containing protein [Deltaproteobacteria bacterium]
MKDYYSILEIQENASEALIKSQYKRLASIYHPDKNPNNVDKFLDLNEAYKTLMNRALRESYDKDFREFNNLKKSQSGDKIIPYRTRLRDGGNVNIEIDFTDDVIKSKDEEFINKTVTLQRHIKCPDCGGEGRDRGTLKAVCPQCNGSGTVKNNSTKINEVCQNCSGYGDIFLYKCKICNGMGRIKASEEITLEFKKDDILSSGATNGNDNNRIIIFSGRGDDGVFGGKNGDLTVSVKIDDDILNKINNSNSGFFRKLLFFKKIN